MKLKLRTLLLIFFAAFGVLWFIWSRGTMVVKGWEFILVALAILGGIMWTLREEKPDLVSMMWFAFATMYVLTLGFIAFAINKGWINQGGAIDKERGGWINEGMHFLLDLNGELQAIGYALLAILAIHAIVWIFTCWVGCAPGLGLVANAIDFSTVIFLKGFASFSALMLAVLSYDLYSGWSNLEYYKALFNVAFAISVFAIGFSILWMHIEKPSVIKWIEARTPNWLAKTQMWATRHIREADGFEKSLLSAHSNLVLGARKSQVGHDQFQHDMRELIQLVRMTAIGATLQGDTAARGMSALSNHPDNLRRIAAICKKWDIEDVPVVESPASASMPN